jgi:hippurate hydrolase
VLDAIHSIIKAECSSAGAPKEPEIVPTTRFPLTENDTMISDTLSVVFKEYLGAEHTEKMEVLAGSEDVPNLAKPNKTPYAFWFWGGTDPQQWDDAVSNDQVDLLPRNHMPTFAPVIEPTMSSGVRALSLVALHFLT